MKHFLLSLVLVISSTAFAAKKGIVCTDNALPDGDKQDYSLELNKDGSYTAYYQIQRGSMRDGVTDPSPRVVLISDLTCSFGKETPALVDCKKLNKSGKVDAYFSTQFVTTARVNDGEEYSSTNYVISAKVEKVNSNGDYPPEMNKHGFIYAEIINGDCEDVK